MDLFTVAARHNDDRAIAEAVSAAFGAAPTFLLVRVAPAKATNATASGIVVVVASGPVLWPRFVWRRPKMTAAVRVLAPNAEIKINWVPQS